MNGLDIIYENKMKIERSKKNEYENLCDKGLIVKYSTGSFIYSKSFNEIMIMLDRIFISWANKDNAVEYIYPDLYSIEDLHKCKYIEQFHHHCMYVAPDNDRDTVDSDLYIINPAMCMHSYIQYENCIIEASSPVCITAKGKCKRNELKGYTTLERLFDFTMREIVFIGSKDYVLSKRQQYIQRIKNLIQDLKLFANISVSNDLFYSNHETKAAVQRKFKLKYELNILCYDSERYIAAGSFNYHNYNFSKAYNIRLSNLQLAHTACVAFGLERFSYLIISQLGFEKSYQVLSKYICENNGL